MMLLSLPDLIGRFHPVLVHLPIGILLLACFFQILTIKNRFTVLQPAIPIMLFWVSWMWMQAHRGKMHDDPLVFAVKDPVSMIAGIAFTVVLLAGSIGLSWLQ